MSRPAASQLRGALNEDGFALVRGMIDSEASAALAVLAQRGVHIVRRSGEDTLDEVARSPHPRSAVNINGLDTAGQGYPWHTDAVPLRENTLRLSVPMVFPAAPSARPEGLDDFLYSAGV